MLSKVKESGIRPLATPSFLVRGSIHECPWQYKQALVEYRFPLASGGESLAEARSTLEERIDAVEKEEPSM